MKKQNKILLGLGTAVATVAPLASVVACGSTDGSTVKAKVSASEIRNDNKAMDLKKTFKGYSKEKVIIIGHKEEIAEQSKVAIAQFNSAFGTNIEIRQISSNRNYDNELASLFSTNEASSIGLVEFEQMGSIKAIGENHLSNITPEEIGFPKGTSGGHKTGNHDTMAAMSESVGIIYNKNVFKKAGIIVHEGASDVDAPEGIKPKIGGAIKEVYTDNLTLESYKKIADQIQTVPGVNAFYSTTKTDGSYVWPYTNHLLSAAIKAAGTEPNNIKPGKDVLTSKVQKSVEDALKIYNKHNNNDKKSTMKEAMKEIADGKVGMTQNGTWGISEILKENPKANVGFLPMPIFGTAGHEHAQFMKGATGQWALINIDPNKQKTMKMFLQWLYRTDTGVTSLYTDYQSKSPYALPKFFVAPSNMLMDSADHYTGNDVTKGVLTLHNFPIGFNNDSDVLVKAINNGFTTTDLSKVIAEYDKLKKAP